jgi:hypothetical protein
VLGGEPGFGSDSIMDYSSHQGSANSVLQQQGDCNHDDDVENCWEFD